MHGIVSMDDGLIPLKRRQILTQHYFLRLLFNALVMH